MQSNQFLSRERKAEHMIFDRSREKLSVNGEWEYLIDFDGKLLKEIDAFTSNDEFWKYLDGLRGKDGCWKTINIPGFCSKNEVTDKFRGDVVFYKEFDVTELPENRRCFLRFGAVSGMSYVFLNGEFLGMHQGGYTPFYFEVTQKITQKNTLFVISDNFRYDDAVPNSNASWYNYCGITRDVDLVFTPEVFISDFRTSLVQKVSQINVPEIEVSFKVDVSDCAEKNALSAEFSINALGICHRFNFDDDAANLHFVVPAAKLKLWSPEHPKLYDVELTLFFRGDDLSDSKSIDSVCDKVGYRQLWVEGKRLELNGKEIQLKGINVHDLHNLDKQILDRKDAKELIKLVKRMGCNFIKLERYPHSEIMSDLADSLGIFLWEQIPVCSELEFFKQPVYKNAENQLLELITRDYNRASVIAWFLGEKSEDNDSRLLFMSNLAMKVQEVDKTRYIVADCNYNEKEMCIDDRLVFALDIVGINLEKSEIPLDENTMKNISKNSLKPAVITKTFHNRDSVYLYHYLIIQNSAKFYTSTRYFFMYPNIFSAIECTSVNPVFDNSSAESKIAF